MSQFRGKIAFLNGQEICEVSGDLRESESPGYGNVTSWRGTLTLPDGVFLVMKQVYRLELDDGRAGDFFYRCSGSTSFGFTFVHLRRNVGANLGCTDVRSKLGDPLHQSRVTRRR